MEDSIQQIEQGQIVIGKPLPMDIYNGEGKLLLRQGQVIETLKQFTILRSKGLFFKTTEYDESDKKVHAIESTPFEMMDEVHTRLLRYLGDPGNVKDFPSRIVELSRIIQAACERDSDAVLATILLDEGLSYAVNHSIHIAIVCEEIAKHLGWEEKKRISLIAASLTANIAMIKLQDYLHNHQDALTEGHKKQIRSHADRGAEMLHQLGVRDNDWIEAVLQHHEAMDGKGYPFGLKGDNVFPSARFIAISDFYCAKIIGRGYRTPMMTNQAMSFVFQGQDSRIDMSMAQHFIKGLGIYLPGTMVKLKNKEIALVTRRSEKAHCPEVVAIMRADRSTLAFPAKRNTEADATSIADVLPHGEMNVVINKPLTWGYSKI